MTRSCSLLLLAVALSTVVSAETLGSVLRSRHVPTSQFSDADLAAPIGGWAASNDQEPFLLAYFAVDLAWDPLGPVRGANRLGPLHVIRYDPATRDLRRADFPEVSARSGSDVVVSCLAGVSEVGEQHGIVHIETHWNPSNGCELLLSPQLALRTAIPGRLLGWVGDDRIIVRRGGVRSMGIAVFDLRRDKVTEVYPPAEEAYRHQPGDDWCRAHNARCYPAGLETDLVGRVAVNEDARVFGFVVLYGADSEETARQVQPLVVAYIYRLRGGRWQHREFIPERLMDLFGVETVGELVSRKPQAAFDRP